jgi:hypothetical protein
VQPGRDGAQEFALLVLPKDALPVAKAKEMGEATRRWAAEQTAPASRDTPERRGASWPYVLAWLLVSGLLWFGERRWLARPSS